MIPSLPITTPEKIRLPFPKKGIAGGIFFKPFAKAPDICTG